MFQLINLLHVENGAKSFYSGIFFRTVTIGPNDVTRDRFSQKPPGKQIPEYRSYGYSKFCNILFANEFNKRYAAEGITANSLHPGIIATPILRNNGLGRFCVGCLIKPATIGVVSIFYQLTLYRYIEGSPPPPPNAVAHVI